MPIDPTKPIDGQRASKAQLRANLLAIVNKIDTLPEDYGTYLPGTLIAIDDLLQGPVPANPLSQNPLWGSLRELGGFKPNAIELQTSQSLNDQYHCGRLLYWVGTGSGTLSLAVRTSSADPTTGISDMFTCTIWRRGAAGLINWSAPGLTNTQPSGYTGVAAGGAVTLIFDGARNEFGVFGNAVA